MPVRIHAHGEDPALHGIALERRDHLHSLNRSLDLQSVSDGYLFEGPLLIHGSEGIPAENDQEDAGSSQDKSERGVHEVQTQQGIADRTE